MVDQGLTLQSIAQLIFVRPRACWMSFTTSLHHTRTLNKRKRFALRLRCTSLQGSRLLSIGCVQKREIGDASRRRLTLRFQGTNDVAPLLSIADGEEDVSTVIHEHCWYWR